jgi:hypothetical protein
MRDGRSFDGLIRSQQQRRRDREAEGIRGLRRLLACSLRSLNGSSHTAQRSEYSICDVPPKIKYGGVFAADLDEWPQ